MAVPYWLEEEAQPLPGARLDGRPDVIVIGAGVTGCSCALTLAEAGLRVVVREAREVASGASGRNGGFALRGAAMPYDRAREQLGRDVARALWAYTEVELDRLAALAGDAFRRSGSLRLAVDAGERTALEAELEALREDGFDAEWDDLRRPPLAGRFAGGIRNPRDGSIAPGRWVRRLAARAAGAGAEFREHAPVASLDELDAPAVVVATDGYTRGLGDALDEAIRPVRNQVLVTEPLPELLYPFPHYARHGFDYWQQLEQGPLLAGGVRDAAFDDEFTAEEAVTAPIQAGLEALVAELVGRRVRITHRWAGIFGLTRDLLPLVGRIPGEDRAWVAAGYSGHGNVLGLGCGDLVARAILGESSPLLELFDPARRPV